jgi:uncharacterized protein
MTREVAFAAVKLAMKDKNPTGLLFYGGEPLLERQLIYDIVEHTQDIKKKTAHTFFYKMTTNGILLDEEFLKFAQGINLTVGFSHDGPAQDNCRRYPDGCGSYDILKDKIPLLLKYQPYAVGMSVIDPSTVHKAADIVQYLFDQGFRYITMNLNYSKDAPWTRQSLDVLEGEYRKLAELYLSWTRDEVKFYLSPFELKILSHLKGGKYNEDRRMMADNQPSVAPDGKLYTSSKFIHDPLFTIGDVFTGFDAEKQRYLSEKGATLLEPCAECVLRPRCNYAYDSLGWGVNGEIITDISPVQCAHEQLLTPIVDAAAETLYKEHNAMFIHKHYNEQYPVVSLIEDQSVVH